jgi:hypothetical protein
MLHSLTSHFIFNNIMNHDTFDSLGASRIDATWGDVCLKSCVGREHIKIITVHRPPTYVRGQGEKGEGGEEVS